MIGSSIVSIKLASAALTREMVNSETARRLVPNVLDSSKRWILGKLQHHNYQRLPQTDVGDEVDSEQLRKRLLEEEAASAEYLVRHWLEALFAWFQVIVLWHEPRVSLCAISSLLSSFLLLTYFAPRFYATIMVALFLYNLNKFWFRHIWPAIRVPPGRDREEELRLDVDRWTYLHPQLMTLSELEQHFKTTLKSCQVHLNELLQLRQRRPVAFASLLCSLFTCTAFLGNRITGMALIFWILAGLMTAPGIYAHLLPEHMKARLRRSLDSFRSIVATTITISNVESSLEDRPTGQKEGPQRGDKKEEEEEEEEDDDDDDDDGDDDGTDASKRDEPAPNQDRTPDQVAQLASGASGEARVAPEEKDLIDLDDDYVLL